MFIGAIIVIISVKIINKFSYIKFKKDGIEFEAIADQNKKIIKC
jgi:hypothetical protein